jgi:hypothetical protein
MKAATHYQLHTVQCIATNLCCITTPLLLSLYIIATLETQQTVTGPDCTVGEKVTCKLTALGRGCVVGSRSKINNCVIMEGVRIGESHMCTVCYIKLYYFEACVERDPKII